MLKRDATTVSMRRLRPPLAAALMLALAGCAGALPAREASLQTGPCLQASLDETNGNACSERPVHAIGSRPGGNGGDGGNADGDVGGAHTANPGGSDSGGDTGDVPDNL